MQEKFRDMLIWILFFSIATEIYNLTHMNAIKIMNINMTFLNSPVLYTYNFIYTLGTILIYLYKYKKRIFVIWIITLLKSIVINQSWFNLFAIFDSTICLLILLTILVDIFKEKFSKGCWI